MFNKYCRNRCLSCVATLFIIMLVVKYLNAADKEKETVMQIDISKTPDIAGVNVHTFLSLAKIDDEFYNSRISQWNLTQEIYFGHKKYYDTTNANKMRELLAYFIGATKCYPPKWWMQYSIDMTSKKPGLEKYEVIAKGLNKVSNHLFSYENIKVDSNDEKLWLSYGPNNATKWSYQENDRKNILGHIGQIAHVANKEWSIVALYEDSGMPYKLSAVDESRANHWESKVWANNIAGVIGLSDHRVELLLSLNRLFVFGGTPQGIYFEIFDIKTGNVLSRYSSVIWNIN